MRWVTGLITFAAILASLKLLVWFLEPRMAFFPWKGIQETPATIGLVYSDHTIETADGEKIRAWWIEHPAPRGQVVYWHGNGGNLSLWLDVLADVHRRGFSVLAADYRGYGASSGKPSEQGIYRDADAVTAYFDRRLRRPNVSVVVWGRSLGSTVAAYMASIKPPDALLLQSPFPDVAFLFARNPVMRFLSLFSSYTFATSRHLQRYTGPLLVIHGDSDSVIPFEAGKHVFESAANSQKSFVALERSDHNDDLSNHPAYWKSIDDFLAHLPKR
jgi:pimeloyl-ACP methyl ester carboxylesterase